MKAMYTLTDIFTLLMMQFPFVCFVFFSVCIYPKTKCLPAGLFPGTEYQISVQAIKGTSEGKPSSVTGATGQCQHIALHDPFTLICY